MSSISSKELKYFFSGEIKTGEFDLIELRLKDFSTFDEYFHAFVWACLCEPQTLMVDYIPYSRADKTINGELDISEKLGKLMLGVGSVVVRGRVHSRKLVEYTERVKNNRRTEVFEESLKHPKHELALALDKTEFFATGEIFKDHLYDGFFEKVREDGKVTSQRLVLTRELIVGGIVCIPRDLKEVALYDDILAGGATLKLALDELKVHFPKIKVAHVYVDYSEDILQEDFIYNGVEVKLNIRHKLLVRESMRR